MKYNIMLCSHWISITWGPVVNFKLHLNVCVFYYAFRKK